MILCEISRQIYFSQEKRYISESTLSLVSIHLIFFFFPVQTLMHLSNTHSDPARDSLQFVLVIQLNFGQ